MAAGIAGCLWRCVVDVLGSEPDRFSTLGVALGIVLLCGRVGCLQLSRAWAARRRRMDRLWRGCSGCLANYIYRRNCGGAGCLGLDAVPQRTSVASRLSSNRTVAPHANVASGGFDK